MVYRKQNYYFLNMVMMQWCIVAYLGVLLYCLRHFMGGHFYSPLKKTSIIMLQLICMCHKFKSHNTEITIKFRFRLMSEFVGQNFQASRGLRQDNPLIPIYFLRALFSCWCKAGLSAGLGVFVILCSASGFFPHLCQVAISNQAVLSWVELHNREWVAKDALSRHSSVASRHPKPGLKCSAGSGVLFSWLSWLRPHLTSLIQNLTGMFGVLHISLG